MRPNRDGRLRRAGALGVGVMLMVMLSASPAGGGRVLAAQQEPTTRVPTMPGADEPNPVPGSVRARMSEQQTRMMNDDRHKRLAEDAARLVVLSSELKADVDKTSKDELSVEVIREAAEIEKLAHDVQNRMKN